jgi:predicted ATP-binding protein involved in virulence
MIFRSFTFSVFMVGATLVSAQNLSPASSETVSEISKEEREAEGARLNARRAALEQGYRQDLKECYQKFDVTGCRLAARERHIEANQSLRKEELVYNARERLIAGQEAQQRLQERQEEAQRKVEEALTNLPKQPKQQTDEATKRQNEITQRAQYEQKQREAQERRNSADKRLRERDKPPADPLPAPGANK